MTDSPNGCGPKGWLGKIIPDHLFGLSVEQACNYHDQQYIEGGDDHQRRYADQIFLNEMLNRIKTKKSGKLISFLRKMGAYSYYYAVRFLGNNFFKKR